MTPGSEVWVCLPVLGSPQVGLSARFRSGGFVFDRNFFEILKVFCSQTPEDLVLEWFRHRNGPDGQVKSASIESNSSTKAHLRSRQRFWSSGAFKMTPTFDQAMNFLCRRNLTGETISGNCLAPH